MATTSREAIMEMIFMVDSQKLVNAQKLVKKNEGRFKHDPLELWGKHQITLIFDDVNNANKFNADRLSTGI